MIEKQLRKQGFQGIPYKVLQGNVKLDMIKLSRGEARSKPMKLSHDISSRIDPFIQDLACTYGKVFFEWQGTTPRVIILDPELIREILSRPFEFPRQEPHPSFKLFLTGLANYNGEKWAKHRKIINPAFHVDKLKALLFPSFVKCCEEMIEKWDKLVGPGSSINELEVLSEFQDLTGDAISKAAFDANAEDGRLIISLLRKQGLLFLQAMFNYFNSSSWSRFLPTKVDKRMIQIHEEVGATVRRILETREKAMDSRDTNKEDLLNFLLKSTNYKNSNFGMTREDVIEECKLFYFAGHESTANLLAWTMICLSMHPNWQEKARQEVLQVLGNITPNFEDMNRLKVVNMVLLEVLRLYPPTSLVRCAHKETEVGDLTIPAGVALHMPVHFIHRDPELWGEDAMEFNPERFSQGFSKQSKDQASLLSFGWGPRICIGQKFAMLEAKLAVSLILPHFSFALSPSYNHAPHKALTLQPRYGAQIILHKI